MKKASLKELLIYALCCDLGIFCKTLISPLSNTITGFLHIPGGVGTSFSLMFLTVACVGFPHLGAGTLMGFIQAMIVLFLGRTGSMGALAPIGYIIPGMAMDLVCLFCRKCRMDAPLTAMLANMCASAAACLSANMIVFGLRGTVLMLYLSTAMFFGAVCGLFASVLIHRLRPFIRIGRNQ